jgi:peroxiredoxin
MTAMLAAEDASAKDIAGLILVDVIPDLDPVGQDRVRAFMVAHAADGFASVDAVARAVASYLPHRRDGRSASGLEKNLRRRGDRWYWHWDPKFLDGVGVVDDRMLDKLHSIIGDLIATGVPILLIRGLLSDVVTEERASLFCERFPEIELRNVSGAAHMVAGDQNNDFTEAVIRFLDSHSMGPVKSFSR